MKSLLKIEGPLAADAPATAVCHALRGGVRTSLARAGSRG